MCVALDHIFYPRFSIEISYSISSATPKPIRIGHLTHFPSHPHLYINIS